MEKNWLIWSIEHNAWWMPNSMGYTSDRSKAGRYTFQDALAIVKDANINGELNEAMVPE